MNLKNREILEGIILRSNAYKTKVTNILEQFSAGKNKAEAESKKYADSFRKEYLSQQNNRLVSDARKELRGAADSFVKKTKDDATALRGQLYDSLKQPVSPALESQLRIYRDYGIKPSRSQVDVLLEMANGNVLALAAIDATLTKNESNFRLKYRPASEFEADLEVIERLTRCAEVFVPLDQLTAGASVWVGTPIKKYRQDGSSFQDGTTWDAVALNLNATSMSTYVKEIEQMPSVWSGNVSTEIADSASQTLIESETKNAETHGQAKPIFPKDEPSVSIDDVNEGAIALAASLGKEKASQTEAMSKLVSEYSR